MKTFKNNDKGYLLVQLLVAVGVGAFIALGIASVLSNAFKGQRVLLSRLEKIDLQDGIKLTLSASDTCQCNFQGFQFPTNSLGAIDVTELRTFNSNCGASKSLARVGQPLDGSQTKLNVDRIQLSDGFQVGAGRYLFSLNVELSSDMDIPVAPLKVNNLSFATRDIGGNRAEVTSCILSSQPIEVVENKCYRITCRSLNNSQQTLTGSGTSGGVITAMAPSGMGMWAIRLRNGAIETAVNCWADQANTTGEQISGHDLCTYYGPLEGKSCSLYGTCRYTRGRANPFASCSYEEC